MKPWRKQFGIWVPDKSLSDERGFISPGAVGAVAGARRRTVAGGGPSFGAEVTRASAAINSNGTQGFTLTGGIAVGKRVVIVVCIENTITVSSVADNAGGGAGNTYAIDAQTTSSQVRFAICSAPVTTALQSGDVITVTFTSAALAWRGAIILSLDNITAKDVSGIFGDFNTVASVSLTTTAASVILGAVGNNGAATTVNSVDGTQSGAEYNWSGGRCWLVYKNEAASGSKTIGLTLSSNSNLREAAVAYK